MTRSDCFVCLLVLCGVMCGRTQAQETTVSGIRETWAETGKRVHSAKFHWTERRVEAKGWKLNPSMGKGINPKGISDPPEDILLVNDSELVIESEKTCYTSSPQTEAGAGGHSPPRYDKWVFGDQVEKVYHPPLQVAGEDAYPHGELTDAKRGNRLFEVASVKPFLWTCRMPSTIRKDCDPALLRIAPRTGDVDGRPMIVLEQITSTGSRSIWVDPQQRFSVRRYIAVEEGKTLLDWQIEYVQDSKSKVWLPSKWKRVVRSPSGATWLTISGEVTSHEINGHIDKSVFDWDFPPETWVHTAEGQYIQRLGGAKRPVTREEASATYRQLLTTESGMALKEPGSGIRRILLFGVLALGLLGLAMVLLRKWKKGALSRPREES